METHAGLPDEQAAVRILLLGWADDERRRYPWSASLHFADTAGDCQWTSSVFSAGGSSRSRQELLRRQRQ
jgi:hypothetical protein